MKRALVIVVGLALLTAACAGGAAPQAGSTAGRTSLSPSSGRASPSPSATAPEPTGAWPQYRFGPDHTGFNPDEQTISVDNVSRLHLLWATPGIQPDLLRGVPLVTGELVLVGTQAVDRRTGAVRWSLPDGASLAAQSAVADGRLFVGYRDGSVTAYEAATATMIWTRRLGSSMRAALPIVVAQGLVFVSGVGARLYALRAADGRVVWYRTTGRPAEPWLGRSFRSPSVSGGIVFVGATDGSLHAFRAATGQAVWSLPGVFVDRAPAVSGGVVYAASYDAHGTLYAVDALTGTVRWAARPGPMNIAPTVAYGLVFVASFPGSPAAIWAYHAATGAPAWSVHGVSPYIDGMAVANGVLYAGDNAGSRYLRAFDARTGRLLWKHWTGRASPVAIAGGVLYVGAARNLCAFGLP